MDNNHVTHLLLACCSIAFFLHLFESRGNSSYYVYDLSWGERGTNVGQFYYAPGDISIDSENRVYIAELAGQRIQIFDQDGYYLTHWPTAVVAGNETNLLYPAALGIRASSDVYIAQQGRANSGVFRFSVEGQYVTNVIKHGTGEGFAYFPNIVVLDNEGNVIVAHHTYHGIQKFDSNGVFQLSFGLPGEADDQLDGVGGIAVDANNDIYVTDLLGNSVKKFTSEGVLIAEFDGGDGGFSVPTGISVDANGIILVSDSFNNRIQLLDVNGAFLGTISLNPGQYGLFVPFLSAVDSDGNFYVIDSENLRIVKFAPTVSGPPVVTDPTFTNITATTATLGGTVTDDGGGTIIERGVYWSEEEEFAPPGEGTKISETGEFGEGVFTVEVTDLPPGTNIFFRAFARHIAAPGYSDEASFTTSSGSVIYVNSDIGDDAYDGYSPTVSGMSGPKATLDGAMAIAVSGDAIEMAPGAYPELPLTLNMSGRNITVRFSGSVTISKE